MADNVIVFRDPSLPAEGIERLIARRVLREGCKKIAADMLAKAMKQAFSLPGVGKLGTEDALPVFMAAMRRELRRSGLF